MNIQVRLTALVFPICLVLVGCAPIIDALVGERVEVDRNDSTRPAVRISIGRAYLVDRSRRTGPFEVTGIDRAAAVYDPLVISAIGDDPEGVQFVELLDISIEPTCFYITPTPTGTTGVSAVAATVTVPGIRTEIPLSSTVATNRMFATKTLVLSKHWCPSTHPGIASAVARVRARAGTSVNWRHAARRRYFRLNTISPRKGFIPGRVGEAVVVIRPVEMGIGAYLADTPRL